MADNVTLNTMSGGSVVATDDITSVHYQIVKIGLGAANAVDMHLDSGQQTMANSVPVTLASDQTDVKITLDSEAVVLGAGSAGIGKLTANSGVDIGDVDVTSVIPGTGATNLGKAVDTATGATDTGVLALATRDDALSALTPIEGDNIQLRVDANGALWTHDDALDACIGGSELQVDIVGSLPAGTAAIGKLAANSGVDIGDVDILTVPAPLSTTGSGTEATALRVTVATDSTGVLSIDDNGGSLTIDGTVDTELTTGDLDTGAGTDTRAVVGLVGSASGGGAIIPGNATDGLLVNLGANNDVAVTLAAETTKVIGTVNVAAAQTIAVTNAGTFATQATLQTGANAIGKLAANSGVDIGDVDVTSVIPGTGATNLGKAIDTASGATDTGIAPLAIRDDALSALTPVEGDYVPLRVNSTGALHVTGGGGGVQYNIDDAGGATDTGTLALAIRDDALSALTPIEGDYVGLRVNSTGALHVTGGGGGTEYSEDAATPATIIGTATMMERDDALSALTPIEGDWASLRCDANGALWTHDDALDACIGGTELQVDIVGALPAGTNAIGKLAANSGVDIGDVDVTSCANTSGDVAHDGADSGNPLKVGGKAYNLDGTAPGTAVAEGDRAQFITDVYGRQYVETQHPNSLSAMEEHTTAQTNNALIAAPGVGLSIYIDHITVSNGATAGNIKFVEDTAGTPVTKIATLYLAINGGAPLNFVGNPIKITANKDFGFTSATVTTHSITVGYHIAP